MTLVDENYAALAECLADLIIKSIRCFLAGLLHVALHLIDVAFGLKLGVARRFSGGLLELALGYLSHVLGFLLFAHRHPMSR